MHNFKFDRRLAPLVCATAALVSACSASDADDLDAGSPAPSHDAATDASHPVVDAAAPRADTGAEGDTRDAEPPVVDAGGARDAADAGRDLSTDRALFFGESRCVQSGLQLCDDFEGDAIDTKTWTVEGDAPVIDGAQHARGKKALHVMKSGNGLSRIKEQKTFPAPHNTYFGRAFVYFAALPASPLTYAHWTLLAASGTGVSGEIRVSGQFQNGKNLFGVGTDNRTDDAGTGDWTSSDSDPAKAPRAVPLNEWVCIEWMHAGSTNETRFFWDATEHPSLHTTSSVNGSTTGAPYLLPQFTEVWIGWQEYQTTTEPFELWVDEVAIDPARIGCVL